MDQFFQRNQCKAENCDNKRKYKMGNAQYFCEDHHYLGNIYTRIEIETFDKLPVDLNIK